jgi:hypothetical protein
MRQSSDGGPEMETKQSKQNKEWLLVVPIGYICFETDGAVHDSNLRYKAHHSLQHALFNVKHPAHRSVIVLSRANPVLSLGLSTSRHWRMEEYHASELQQGSGSLFNLDEQGTVCSPHLLRPFFQGMQKEYIKDTASCVISDPGSLYDPFGF